ncbi:MAG: FG-GAP repeat protein [Pseudomonadota bacterium]
MKTVSIAALLATAYGSAVDASPGSDLASAGGTIIYQQGVPSALTALGKGALTSIDFSLPRPVLEPGETFGNAVAVSGNLVAVATRSEALVGRVFLFRREGDAFVEDGSVFAVSDSTSCTPDLRLSISNSLVFISSPREPDTPQPELCPSPDFREGVVFVAAKCPSGEWTLAGQIFPDGLTSQQSTAFGAAVGFSDDLMAVGSPADGDGAVRIFELPTPFELDCDGDVRIEPTLVREVDRLLPPASGKGSATSRFGQALDFRRGKLVVGAPGGVGQATAGSAHLFELVAGNLSSTGDPIVSSGSSADDQFGFSVAIDGDTVAIGAPGQDQGNGAAYAFGFRSRQETFIPPPIGSTGAAFGFDVAFYEQALIVSAPFFVPPGGKSQRKGALVRVDLAKGTAAVDQLRSAEDLSADLATLAAGVPESDSGLGDVLITLDTELLFGVGFER